MPHVVNGCGTWYYGKQNLETYDGICRFCGKAGKLRAYDTTMYIVFCFIPIFPLKKRRVIDECPHCKRHYALSPGKWQEVKGKDIQEAMEKYHSDPTNAELAKAALAKHLVYRERENFLELAEEVKAGFPNHTEMYSAIGQLEMALGFLEEAEQTFLEIQQFDPANEEAREDLAEVYIQKLEPENAEPHLAHILEKGIPDKVSHYIRLAGAYQGIGQHQRALEILDLCRNLVPFIEKEKIYRKMQKQSKKHLMSGKRMVPKWLQLDMAAGGGGGRDLSGRLARQIPLLILAAVISIYLISAIRTGENRKIYLVNGLAEEYSVRVNGQEHRLMPLQPTGIKTGEGLIEVEPVKGNMLPEPMSVTIKTNFFTRPFVKKTYILNPDKVAILAKDKIFYVPDNQPVFSSQEPVCEFFSNQSLYCFGKVNYLFERFPGTIKLSGNKSEHRTRLYVLGQDGDLSYESRLAAYLEYAGTEKMKQYIQARLKFTPQDPTLIYLLSQTGEPEVFRTVSKPFLEQRPVCMHWHRAYQDWKEKQGEDEGLAAEYMALLATEPDNKILQYLAGRVTHNTDEQLRLIGQAAGEPDPLPQALVALCYHYMSQAEYQRSLSYIRQACKLEPDNQDYQHYLLKALAACQEWDTALKMIRELREQNPEMNQYALQEAYLLAQTGRLEEAKQEINQYVEGIYGTVDHEQKTKDKESLNNYLLYIAGSHPEAIQAFIAMGSRSYEIIQAIEEGDMEKAETISKTQEPLSQQDHVLLYVGEKRAGREEQAKAHLDAIVESLAKGSYEQRRYGEALKTGEAADHKELLRFAMEVEEKRILLLAMAYRFPEQQKEYLDLACRLFYDKTFPYHFVKALAESR